jgi:hypothetical protein
VDDRYEELAHLFIEGLHGDPDAFRTIAQEIHETIEEDTAAAQELMVLTSRLAKTDYEKSCVGAFIVEEALRAHGAKLVSRVERLIGEDRKFAEIVLAAHLTGVTEEVWRRINRALSRAGISDDQLVDWSEIRPSDSDEGDDR